MFLRPLLALVAAFGAVGAHACSIPVFRYALDRWPADPYVLEVSAADAREENVGRFLRNLTDSTPLNLVPARPKEDGVSRLNFPHPESDTPAAWSGALDGAMLTRLTESPAREEIVRRILDGEAGVWLIVESGDRAADDQAAAALKKRLRYLEQVAQLPQIDPSDPTSKLGPGPALRVKFSTLRLRRDNSAEAPLLRMLAGPKAGVEAASGPWLALVFGRGRVLGSWPAAGFGDEQIDETCLFLLGACSCQVKRLNPGWDLLVKADWNEALRAIGFPSPDAPAVQATTPIAAAETPQPETVTLTGTAPATIAPTSAGASPIVITAGVLLALGTVLAWRSIRKSP